jgi:hypothetical protein
LRLGSSAFLLAGCAVQGPAGEGDASAPFQALASTREIRGNFSMRQQIDYRFGERRGSFEAVVQKRCDVLTLVGFTPFGTRAFSIEQRGREVSARTHVSGTWPFPPHFILLDVHRAYLVPMPERPPADGFRELRHGAERVSETWAAGRLLERRFDRLDTGRPGPILVRYVDGSVPGAPAREIQIANQRHGYELDVTTLSRSELDCRPGPGDDSDSQ